MQPRDRLTSKEVQVATLVWQGLTNKDIAGVIGTSEQVVKNHLRTTFDKLGVWTRLELALYVASHGGANWHSSLGGTRSSPPDWRESSATPQPSVLASGQPKAAAAGVWLGAYAARSGGVLALMPARRADQREIAHPCSRNGK